MLSWDFILFGFLSGVVLAAACDFVSKIVYPEKKDKSKSTSFGFRLLIVCWVTFATSLGFSIYTVSMVEKEAREKIEMLENKVDSLMIKTDTI